MYPKGLISSDILSEAITYLDQLNVFEHTQDGQKPFELFDVHGSRIQLPFLEYINYTIPDVQSICIFTPRTTNTTNVWQIRNSCNQNGC